MTQYYIIDKTSKGTPRTTLPVLLNKELLEHTLIKISSPEDLDWIRNMAQDRTTWKNFTEVIITGAKEKYDEVRKRKRTDLTPTSTTITPNRPRTQVELKRTPLALDFRKRSIQLLGSPYTNWYPSPVRRRYTDHPIIRNN